MPIKLLVDANVVSDTPAESEYAEIAPKDDDEAAPTDNLLIKVFEKRRRVYKNGYLLLFYIDFFGFLFCASSTFVKKIYLCHTKSIDIYIQFTAYNDRFE